MSLDQLKQLVKENNIKKTSHLKKSELISLLTERGIAIPAREPRVRVVRQENVDPKFERLRTIRTNPRRVRLTAINTNEVREFGSLYAGGKFLGHSSKIIHDYHGKVYKNKFKVEILGLIEQATGANIDGNEESQS